MGVVGADATDWRSEDEIMRVQYTPGPWRQYGLRVLTGSGDVIADMRRGYDTISYDQALATAQVIAAAPDLLTALQELLKDSVEQDPQLLHAAKRAAAYAAIAKAAPK
jgi:hypothetical protein